MCISAATLNLREARRLEWASAGSDEEDKLPSSRNSLGLLLADLGDESDTEAPNFSPALHVSVSSHGSHAHFVAAEVQHHLSYMQQVESQRLLGRFCAEVQQVHSRELDELYSIREGLTQRQAQMTAEEAGLQEQLKQQRDHHLRGLRQEHSTKADKQIQENVQTQEEERLRQQELLKQQEQHRQRQQHEQQQREKQQREQHLQELEQKKLQERAIQQQQAHSSQLQQPGQQPQLQQVAPQLAPQAAPQPAQPLQTGQSPPAAANDQGSGGSSRTLRIADSAAEHEELYRRKLQDAQAAIKHYAASDEHKKERRDIDKQLTKVTQQISGTQYNVKSKANTIVTMFNQLPEVQRAYAYLQLAKRFLLQCENQISLNQPSCFPYAEVAVAVGQSHPGFAELMIARLHEVCPLTVPKYHMFRKATADVHYQQMGYERVTDPKTGKEGFEMPDRYLQRLGGFVAFYAALMQSEQWPLRSPVGVSSAWQYMARLLNSLPANRTSATALYALLQTAGYRLHQVFKDQFIKLLRCTYDNFWMSLEKSADPDVRATAARIKQFIMDHAYQRPPEGSELPEYDQSTDVGLA